MTELHSIVSQEQIELEQAFAGCVLINGDHARKTAGWLNPETIMTPDIQVFWKRVQEGETAIEVGFSMNIGAELLKWSQTVTNSMDVAKYANALVTKDYLRVGILSAELMAQHAQAGDPAALKQVVDEFAQRQRGGSSTMRNAVDIGESLVHRIEQGNMSIPWGIESLDIATRGLERGTLTVLGARPSMGKSSIAFQCNEYQALELGLRVGVFALEMSGEQMFSRRNCHKIGSTWADVRSGMVSSTDEESLKAYVREYSEEIKDNLFVNDNTYTTSADIVRTQQRENFDVIMIDHLGLLKDKKYKDERHDQKLGRITEQLHSLAKNTQSVVILLCQLNRGVEGRTDKRPNMGDLRNSGDIEQNADNVALLYGDWYYDKSADNTTEVNFTKFRDGLKDATAYVEFDMKNQQFKSVEVKEGTQVIDDANEEGYTQINMQDDIPF